MTTAHLWGKVKSKLFQPVNRDRAGAPSNVLLAETVQQLKNIHRGHYVSDEINWSIWATYILKQPENDRPRMSSDAPPINIVHLFRSVPLPQDQMLDSCRKDLKVANTVVDFFEEDLKSLRSSYDSLSTVMVTFGARLSAMEKKVGEFRAMLTSMNGSVTPSEEPFSRSIADEITDLVDVDHE